jgi:hypothetical protein
MIDGAQDLPISRQAKILNISRSCVYYKPKSTKLAALIGVENPGLPVSGQCFLQRLDAKIRFHRDRHAMAEDAAAAAVHDGGQIDEAARSTPAENHLAFTGSCPKLRDHLPPGNMHMRMANEKLPNISQRVAWAQTERGLHA